MQDSLRAAIAIVEAMVRAGVLVGELANAIFEYLSIWHNRRRRHSALGWLSPIEFESNSKIVVA